MHGDRRDDRPSAGPRGLAWWAAHGDRYVLPVAGAIAFTLGLAPVVGLRGPWGAFTPVLLVLLGITMILSALVRSTFDPAHSSERPGKQLPEMAETARARSPVRSYSPAPATSAVPSRRRDARGSKTGVRAESAPAASPSPGDRLWSSWVAPVRKLPGELVGPVPETAYVPHRPGAPSLYEEGEPVFLGPAKIAGRASERYVVPLDEGEFSSFPSLVSSYALEPEALAAVRVQDLEGEPTRMGVPSSIGAMARLPRPRETDSSTPPVERARSNPLNSARPERRERGPVRSPRCANCRNELDASATPSRCIACLRRLCSECVATVHRTSEGIWCPRCASASHHAELSREFARRAVPNLDGSSWRKLSSTQLAG